MEIIRVEIEDTLRIRGLVIEPDGPVVEIRGKNGVGKTCAGVAIEATLFGKGKIAQPIRRGAKKATTIVTLGDNGEIKLHVTKMWTAADEYLTVRNHPGGRPLASPQAILDAIVSPLAFDPQMFAHAGTKDQFEMSLEVIPLGLGLDYHKHKAERAEIYEERRVANAEKKRTEIVLAETPEPPDGTPDVEVLTGALLRQRKDLADKHRNYEEIVRHSEHAQRACEEAEDQITTTDIAHKRTVEQMDDRIEQLRREREAEIALQDITRAEQDDQLANAEEEAKLAMSELSNAEEPRNEQFDEIDKAIETAAQVNANVARKQQHAAAVNSSNQANATAKDKDDALTAHDRKLDEALENAKVPIEGMTLEDGCVKWDGLPISQAAESSKIVIGLALAMAKQPELRVVWIQNASLMDAGTKKLVYAYAKTEHIQVIEEIVTDDPELVIVCPKFDTEEPEDEKEA